MLVRYVQDLCCHCLSRAHNDVLIFRASLPLEIRLLVTDGTNGEASLKLSERRGGTVYLGASTCPLQQICFFESPWIPTSQFEPIWNIYIQYIIQEIGKTIHVMGKTESHPAVSLWGCWRRPTRASIDLLARLTQGWHLQTIMCVYRQFSTSNLVS